MKPATMLLFCLATLAAAVMVLGHSAGQAAPYFDAGANNNLAISKEPATNDYHCSLKLMKECSKICCEQKCDSAFLHSSCDCYCGVRRLIVNQNIPVCPPETLDASTHCEPKADAQWNNATPVEPSDCFYPEHGNGYSYLEDCEE